MNKKQIEAHKFLCFCLAERIFDFEEFRVPISNENIINSIDELEFLGLFINLNKPSNELKDGIKNSLKLKFKCFEKYEISTKIKDNLENFDINIINALEKIAKEVYGWI